MKVVKSLLIASLISLAISPAFAKKITITPSNSKISEIETWKVAKAEDGMFFILGEYTKKLLVIHSNEIGSNGVAPDTITVSCNSIDENTFRDHRLAPGGTITCKGNYHDVASLYVTVQDFKNGAEGTFEFKPLEK